MGKVCDIDLFFIALPEKKKATLIIGFSYCISTLSEEEVEEIFGEEVVAEDHLEEVDTNEEPVGNEQANFEDEEYEQSEEEITKGKAKKNEQADWRGFPGFSQNENREDEKANEESE